ncbi:hypothetical protein JCM24511_02186 [Saitozyma sp. JCM 24511]|nr:hypothetical protein JCM24511_02186 [Saitozyma sp. JCM 24511]
MWTILYLINAPRPEVEMRSKCIVSNLIHALVPVKDGRKDVETGTVNVDVDVDSTRSQSHRVSHQRGSARISADQEMTGRNGGLETHRRDGWMPSRVVGGV